jgi:hypothetical protein
MQILVLDHYLEILARKPGALPNATALARARAFGAFSEVHDRFWTTARERIGDREGTNALIEVLLAQRQLPAAAVIAGMTAAMSVHSVDPAVVAIEARKHLETDAVIIPIGEHLARFDRPAPSLDRSSATTTSTPSSITAAASRTARSIRTNRHQHVRSSSPERSSSSPSMASRSSG